VQGRTNHRLLLRYSPMRTFAPLMDFSQSALVLTSHFQFVILHLLTFSAYNSAICFLVVLLVDRGAPPILFILKNSFVWLDEEGKIKQIHLNRFWSCKNRKLKNLRFMRRRIGPTESPVYKRRQALYFLPPPACY